MLTIREAQFQVFRQAAARALAQRIAECLAPHWPEEYGELGPDGVRELIENGIEKARKYGITQDRDLGRYVNLMLFLGEEFDSDPELPWAAETLCDPGLQPQSKLDRLLEHSLRWAEGSGEPENGKKEK